MGRGLKDVLAAAMQLDPQEKLLLMQDLNASLQTAEEHEIEEAWLDEAERRYEEWKAGRAQTFSGEEVFARLREKYGSERIRASRRR